MSVAPLYPYLPPSRQTWETLTFFWQFFPLVRNSSSSISTEDTLLITILTVCVIPMADSLVPYGQNIHRFPLEYPRQDRLGDDGGAGLHHVALHYVHAASHQWSEGSANG